MTLKSILLHVARAAGAFRLARFLTRDGIRILCYHGAWIGPHHFGGDALFIRPETFQRRLDLIRELGYPIVDLEEALAGAPQPNARLQVPVVITIDDGWFSAFKEMLPALVERRIPATLYCDTQHLQSRQPVPRIMARYILEVRGCEGDRAAAHKYSVIAADLSTRTEDLLSAVRELCDSIGADFARYADSRVFEYMSAEELREFDTAPGLRIELHTHRHSMGSHSPAEIVREITDNRRALAELLQRKPNTFTHFCYPSGDYLASDRQHLSALGIRSATTVEPGIASRSAESRYRLPRLLDGDHITEIAFEAELSGFMHLARRLLGRVSQP